MELFGKTSVRGCASLWCLSMVQSIEIDEKFVVCASALGLTFVTWTKPLRVIERLWCSHPCEHCECAQSSSMFVTVLVCLETQAVEVAQL